jgi:hypothetical protein
LQLVTALLGHGQEVAHGQRLTQYLYRGLGMADEDVKFVKERGE